MESEDCFELERDNQNEDITSAPEFIQASDGSYVVLVRFRCEKDFHEFVDIIEQPKLKIYNKNLIRKTTYPNIGVDNPFEEFE